MKRFLTPLWQALASRALGTLTVLLVLFGLIRSLLRR
jgi:hypothetical protein